MSERTRTATVVVGDDDRDVRDLVSMKLTLAGYDVVEATDGFDALARIRDVLPDACVLDSALPGLSGVDVIAQLHADEKTREIPVLLLGSSGVDLDLAAAQALGAADCLTKPFSPRELLARVDAILGVE